MPDFLVISLLIIGPIGIWLLGRYLKPASKPSGGTPKDRQERP